MAHPVPYARSTRSAHPTTRRRLGVPSSPLLLVLALLTVALPAAADRPLRASGPSAPPGVVEEVVVDTFSVDELAAAARKVPEGGRLYVSGLALDAGAAPEALEMERFRVFSPDARIVVHGEDGEEVLPAPDHAYFRGRVAGDAASLAVLGIREDGEVRGIVQKGGRSWVIGSPRRGAGAESVTARALAAVEASSQPPQGEPFTCGQGDLPPVPEDLFPAAAPNALTPASLTTTPYTVRVAVESDWEFYNKFGNTPAATAYVGDLFAFASSLYDQEINTDLQVSHLTLRTTSGDPWGQTSTLCGLFEFGRYWNDNMGGVDRTIAHFLSGKSNGGGVAWVGVLCGGGFNYNHGGACSGLSPQIDNYGGAYGYSGDLDGNFNLDNPTLVWDAVVVSHEIGHNFNSPHTHCYAGLEGSPNPVDQCYNGESGCYSGPSSLPCGTAGAGCGTLMSYCHFQPGGLSNIAPSFGTGHPHGVLPQRVPDRMRAHVEATAILQPACLARLGCQPLTLSHTGSGLDPVAFPTSSPGCNPGSYDEGELIFLTASPTAGWRVGTWSGTNDDSSTFLTNFVTMPGAPQAVSAGYLSGCDDLLLDSGTDNGTITHDACGQITAGTTYRVGATGTVTLRSYQRVVLTNGFRVDAGGSLAVVLP